MRWASLHSSYLYESVPNSPVSAGVLEVLSTLGRGAMRLAMLDRARRQRRDFASNNEASTVLQSDSNARAALGDWLNTLGAGTYGIGESALQSSSRVPESVALQILGALTLVYASQAPADALLEAARFAAPAHEPDWFTVLTSALRGQPQIERFEQGADHEKTFTVVVTARGRTATGTGKSFKAARVAAMREFVTRYLPGAIPKNEVAASTSHALPYPSRLTSHANVVRQAQQAFEISDAGLVTQALTHRSWIHENKTLVAATRQRDYGVLAAEGSELLGHLVRHQNAVQLVNSSLTLPTGRVTSPSVTGEAQAALFDAMSIEVGVLRSHGPNGLGPLTIEMKSDVVQALVAAAWRANGDRLYERQPAVLRQWLRAFTPPADPSTQLQEYCARADVSYSFDYARRGPGHISEFQATVTFDVPGRPTCVGEWRIGKTPAKHAASARALDDLIGTEANGRDANNALVRGFMLAEMRAIDPEAPHPEKELTNRTLGVDRLAAGDYTSFASWAQPRAKLVPKAESAITNRLATFYESVLTRQRRDLIRTWIVRHTPAQGGRSADPAARIRSWWRSTDPGRLALVAELLPALRATDWSTTILEFIETQARSVAITADTTLEAERTEEASRLILTMRLEGTGLSQAFDPIITLVQAAGVGATWAREAQGVSVTIPVAPTSGDAITLAAANAVRNALTDPWLGRIDQALTAFLSVTEKTFGTGVEPSIAQIDELALAELSLILQLRSDGEDE